MTTILGTADRADAMCRTWGEVVSYTTAAKILSCDRHRIPKMVEEGLILETSMKHKVSVRSIAEYLYGNTEYETREPKRRANHRRFAM